MVIYRFVVAVMPTDRLGQTFTALADPTRRAILARLVSGETSITALAEPLSLSLPAISGHPTVPGIDVAFAPHDPHHKAIAPGGIRRTLAVTRKAP